MFDELIKKNAHMVTFNPQIACFVGPAVINQMMQMSLQLYIYKHTECKIENVRLSLK